MITFACPVSQAVYPGPTIDRSPLHLSTIKPIKPRHNLSHDLPIKTPLGLVSLLIGTIWTPCMLVAHVDDSSGSILARRLCDRLPTDESQLRASNIIFAVLLPYP